jgi:SAM-dependent methyltransferase
MTINHPAKYSDVLLPIMNRMLDGYQRVLDPFAGTGKLRLICPDATLLEIEPEWAAISGAVVGDATAMPFDDSAFDAVATSPTYGNRMADNFQDHQTEKRYRRNTYRHALGRPLTVNNSGAMQWGDAYRSFHRRAWHEVHRVLRPGGIFVLNISDHIRKGVVQEVTSWHREAILDLRFEELERVDVPTRRQRMGKNREARVPYESVILFRKLEERPVNKSSFDYEAEAIQNGVNYED